MKNYFLTNSSAITATMTPKPIKTIKRFIRVLQASYDDSTSTVGRDPAVKARVQAVLQKFINTPGFQDLRSASTSRRK